jgi:uncharacterized protein
MAGTTLFTLLDDLAALLDDVAALTKVATQKTAGVLGDDLALNAEQVAGVDPERELPVVWAVARGSTVNKLILVPAALLISAVAGWAITPLLMLGGAFLCYEGCEKLAHRYLAPEEAQRSAERVQAIADPTVDMVAFEKDKIRGAVRTDFILSAEVIVISLGAIATAPLGTRVVALVAIALIMTVGVYGLVAGIVKLDDLGLHLSKRSGPARKLGQLILRGAPYLMKGLSIAGTVAMFLVGGGILVHGIPGAEALGERLAGVDVPAASLLVPGLFSGLVGLLAGALLLAVVTGVQRLLRLARSRGQ